MQIFNKNHVSHTMKLLKEIPSKIEVQPNKPTVLIFNNGSKCNSCCLNCKNKKCMYFSENEINTENFINFPFDKNNSVCPVDAIEIDDIGQPNINKLKCINCGLCAKRCPISAIYFKNNGFHVCNEEISVNIDVCSENSENIEKQNLQLAKAGSIKRDGIWVIENNIILTEIYNKLFNISSKYYDQIGRNLLIGFGCNASKRRIGDVYTRMDAVYSFNKCFGAVEVEFGKDTLDASRAVLDDIATLNVRYNISKSDNKPIVMCLQLPNARQGYWQVLKDIKKIISIPIQTLSIGAILILLWNNATIDFDNACFYIDYDNMSLRAIIEKLINRKINISIGLLGILEPEK